LFLGTKPTHHVDENFWLCAWTIKAVLTHLSNIKGLQNDEYPHEFIVKIKQHPAPHKGLRRGQSTKRDNYRPNWELLSNILKT
jgi:hypothetical protein